MGDYMIANVVCKIRWIQIGHGKLFKWNLAMLAIFQFSILSRSCFSAPIKLLPLYDQIMAVVPLNHRNTSIPITKELVSMNVNISTETARVERQVKRNPMFYKQNARQLHKWPQVFSVLMVCSRNSFTNGWSASKMISQFSLRWSQLPLPAWCGPSNGLVNLR